MKLSKIVVISRRTEILDLAQQIAAEVFAADTIAEAADIAGRVSPELFICDLQFQPGSLDVMFNYIDDHRNAQMVVIENDKDDRPIPPAALREHPSCHFLDGSKEIQPHQILEIFKKNHSMTASGEMDIYFSDPLAASAAMVGKSVSIRHTLRMIKLVAASQCNPILVMGEMGTGKELAAKAIHDHRCPDKAFIAVNCASLSANLLESELFGHEKGAFTSADRDKTGLLELAGTGSIFLDEISEVPIELQAKLLRVIQEKTFRKVGGTREIPCRATIIASSNRNLQDEVLANRFRGDLYHRLSIFPVALSPLRSSGRRGDIRLLADYFLKTSTICPEKSGYIKSITNLALEALEEHQWPGNVRELRNVIERAILLETSDKIGINSIIINPEEPHHYERQADKKIKDFSLAKAEQELIARVLQETNWQKTKAAELLGISRATLYAKVKQHKIDLSDNTPGKQIESESFSDPVAVA